MGHFSQPTYLKSRHSSPDPAGPNQHHIGTEHAKILYNLEKTVVLCSVNPETVWHYSKLHKNNSLVRMVQIYIKKTTKAVKANSIVVYQVRTVVLSSPKLYRRFLTDHGYTFLGFLSVSTFHISHGDDCRPPGSGNGFELSEKEILPSDIMSSNLTGIVKQVEL